MFAQLFIFFIFVFDAVTLLACAFVMCVINYLLTYYLLSTELDLSSRYTTVNPRVQLTNQ